MSLTPSVVTGAASSSNSTATSQTLSRHVSPLSGGGDPGDPPAPTVTASGGLISVTNSGSFSIPGGVPVGDRMSFNVTSYGGWVIDTNSIWWEGDSGYANYFADPATTTVEQDPTLLNVSPDTNVTNFQSYTLTFIVTPQTDPYSVTVHVGYLDPNGGEDIPAPLTTVTFNAVSPTTATLTTDDGYWATYEYTDPDSNKTYEIVGYSDTIQPWNRNPPTNDGLGDGITLIANTKANTGYGGAFMLLQLVDTYRGKTDSNGNTSHISSPGDGATLDDGPDDEGNPGPIGMTGWSLDPGKSTNALVTDPPESKVGIDYQWVKIDDSFSTYLMYNPGPSYSGVWIALYKAEWSVTREAASPNWGSGFNSASSAPETELSPTSGSEYFPSWPYDTAELTWQEGP